MADFEADAKLQETVQEVYSDLDHLRNTHIVKALCPKRNRNRMK